MNTTDHAEPNRLNLRQLRNQAKELRKAYRKGEAEAVSRVRESHPRYGGLADAEIEQVPFSLADAHLVIARERGYKSWPKLKRQIEGPSADALTMHEAVTKYDPEAVETVYQRDHESIDELDSAGNPPLYKAALYRNEPAIKFLIDHGATVDLFASAYLGDPVAAENLLGRTPELIHLRNDTGMTALHFAARKGAIDVAEILLRHGADVNATDHRGNTPLLEASHGGPWKDRACDPLIEMLLEHGATVDLHTAAAIGRVDRVESLLREQPELIDSLDENGHSAVYLAAHNDQLDVVKCLVRYGADLNRSDAVGTAALHRTSQQCSDELIRYLIDNGADAHLCCHVACGDEGGTLAALQRDPRSTEEVFYEYTAVGYAIHCWQLGSLRLLLRHGCRLNRDDCQHILRISDNDRQLLDELLAIEGSGERE